MESVAYSDSITIVYDTLDVRVPVSGYLDPYRQETLKAFDSLRVITVLVEKGQNVKKGDLLLSVWDLWNDREYTPANYYASFDGTVIGVRARAGAIYPREAPLLTIADNKMLLLEARIKQQSVLGYLEEGQKTSLSLKGDLYEGVVNKINREALNVQMLFDNPGRSYWPENIFITAYVDIGPRFGGFIHARHFKTDQALKLLMNDSLKSVEWIGRSDSLLYIGKEVQKTQRVTYRNGASAI